MLSALLSGELTDAQSVHVSTSVLSCRNVKHNVEIMRSLDLLFCFQTVMSCRKLIYCMPRYLRTEFISFLL
jgi:hypothetical protein